MHTNIVNIASVNHTNVLEKPGEHQLKKTWITHVNGLEDWPKVIFVRAESDTDARGKILGWPKRKKLRRLNEEFRPSDIEVEEALDLEEQREIDDWLESKDFDTWRSHVQARYPCSGE